MPLILWVTFALAAIFEVGGDAVIRMGIKNNNIILMFLGAATLGGYGLIVNSIDWDFSKIFGVYVAVFALFGVLFGKFLFREQIQLTPCSLSERHPTSNHNHDQPHCEIAAGSPQKRRDCHPLARLRPRDNIRQPC